MNFEKELLEVKNQIKNAKDNDELEYLRKVYEKKYWWTSILINGLFYGLNGKVGKMIISWLLAWTLIYPIWIIYTSYRDQKEFNNMMEKAILERKRELERNTELE